jgi:hypothetical protein
MKGTGERKVYQVLIGKFNVYADVTQSPPALFYQFNSNESSTSSMEALRSNNGDERLEKARRNSS